MQKNAWTEEIEILKDQLQHASGGTILLEYLIPRIAKRIDVVLLIKRYMKNAYRVLLTRARQGLVIYIPKGNPNDKTSAPSLYDETFNYLRSIGIEELD